MSLIHITCRAATALVLRGNDHRLHLADRMRLRLHMLICKACPHFVRQAALMQRAMGPWRTYRDEDSPPPPPAA